MPGTSEPPTSPAGRSTTPHATRATTAFGPRSVTSSGGRTYTTPTTTAPPGKRAARPSSTARLTPISNSTSQRLPHRTRRHPRQPGSRLDHRARRSRPTRPRLRRPRPRCLLHQPEQRWQLATLPGSLESLPAPHVDVRRGRTHAPPHLPTLLLATLLPPLARHRPARRVPRHLDAIGARELQLEDRLRYYLIYIGIDGKAYNAFTHRWNEFERSGARTLEFATMSL